MTSVARKIGLGVAALGTLAMTAAPADAQRRYRRHHGDDAAVAIGAGIIGLGIGAAIASSNRGGYYSRGYGYDPYYGRGYDGYGRGYYGYDRGYGYGRGYGYDRGHRYGRGYGYGRRCVTRREFDPYYGRWLRVRYC